MNVFGADFGAKLGLLKISVHGVCRGIGMYELGLNLAKMVIALFPLKVKQKKKPIY